MAHDAPMRLFSGPLSMYGAKAQIAMIEKGLEFELVMVPFETSYDLAGQFSLADIASYMAQLFGARMGVPMSTTHNLLRWRDRMTFSPSVQAVVKPMVHFLISRGRPVPADLESAIGLH